MKNQGELRFNGSKGPGDGAVIRHNAKRAREEKNVAGKELRGVIKFNVQLLIYD